MRTRSSSNLPVESPHNPSTSNPKHRNHRRSKKPFILKESPVDMMADQRTMAEVLHAPTEGYAEAIVLPPILAKQFELKHCLINMMISDQFFGLEKDNPHDHIHWSSPSLAKKEPSHSILTWEDLVSKFINEFFPSSRTKNLYLLRVCPHHGFTELHQLDTFYNALNPADQDSLNSTAGGNLLERRTQDVLTIIENKSKVCNSQNKSVVPQVKSSDANSNSSSEIAKLTHAVNQQTSAVTTAMTAILKQFQATPPPALVKSIEEICVTCGAAAVNYNQGNSGYRPLGVANQIRPPGFAQSNVQNNQNWFGQPQGYNRGNNFNPKQSYQAPTQQNQVVPLSELEKVKRVNEVNMKAMKTQINNVKNDSGSLPNNTIANPKGELKSITTRSGIVLDGPSIPIPPPFINPEDDERVEETLTDQDLVEYTIKGSSSPQYPLSFKNAQAKAAKKDEVQIHKFWQMFTQLHINNTLVDALILIPKYQKILKALLSNKEKLLELANTPLNKNCSVVILKKLPEKFGDPGKFLIPCGFSELKCKALANLGASINLMPVSVWKKLGLPELISTRMTLKLANRAICTPAGIARDVFILVGKFTFPADFVIVDYESDLRVPFILGRPFLQTARALINVHGEEMILRDGDERLTLNMIHDTSSYSNWPQKESINLINVFNDSSEDFLENLFSTNQPSGNPIFSSHLILTSSKVKDDILDPEGGNVIPKKLLDLDSTKDLHPPHNVNPLSGSTTSSSPNQLLKEFVDELALITFPPGNDDLQFDIESDLKEIEYLLHHDPIMDIDSILKDSINQSNLADLNDNLVDTMPEKLVEEHALDYSSSLLYDEYNDDLFEVESDTEYVYDDPFDSKGEKIKESKLLIDELDLPSDFLPSSEYNSFLSKDFSMVDALPSTNNEDKNAKKLAISHASLILEDFDLPLYELPFFKEVPGAETPLLFSSKNKGKVFKPGILTSKGVHSSLIPEL
uniref:Reverse transcriptase domain-containing protein n=1 Tax=Tanacetum cinerariifolium TaxID=118510 RepID=A0A6L2P6I0_TANCI|nr:hypothetical protein [Tanacetum cinerariifolium]